MASHRVSPSAVTLTFQLLLTWGDKGYSSIRPLFLSISLFEGKKVNTKWGSVTLCTQWIFVLKQKMKERTHSVLRNDEHWGCYSSHGTHWKFIDFSEPLISCLTRIICRTHQKTQARCLNHKSRYSAYLAEAASKMYKEMNDQPQLKLRPAASIPSQVLGGWEQRRGRREAGLSSRVKRMWAERKTGRREGHQDMGMNNGDASLPPPPRDMGVLLAASMRPMTLTGVYPHWRLCR